MKKRYVVAGILAAAGLICGGIAYYQYYQDAHAGQEYEKIKENYKKKVSQNSQMMLMPEVENLIQSLLSLNNPYICPHGRPTTIKIDKDFIKNKLSIK